MKLLFLTVCPSPYRVNFFNELTQFYDLTVLFEEKRLAHRDSKWKSDEEHKFHTVYLERSPYVKKRVFCPEVTKYLKAHRHDPIIVGGYSTPTGLCSVLYLKLHRIPFILNCDGGMIKNDSKIRAWGKRFLIGSASAWLSTGETCTAYLEHYGAKRERIYRYPFTSVREKDIVSVNEEQKKQLRQKLGIREERVILFVGSFIYRKGLDILLAACKDLTDTAVVLAGGADPTNFLPDDSVNLKKHLYTVGFQTEQEIKKYYAAADVFVLPTREDIWGLVINEAMAAGLPVITTDKCVAGLELVENGENGYLVPTEDVNALREKIETVLSDSELREHMSKTSLQKIQGYTIESMARRHMEILEQVGAS